MRLLLDTHLLIWAALYPHKLSLAAIALMANDDNQLLFSPISIVEVAIKYALNRPDFHIDVATFRLLMLSVGYVELPLTGAHAVGMGRLPNLHKDPFDRILIAQALVEQISLVTADKVVASYPAPVILV